LALKFLFTTRAGEFCSGRDQGSHSNATKCTGSPWTLHIGCPAIIHS
jgi:hypothetical protein